MSHRLLGLCLAVATALAGLPAGTAAARPPITGELSAPGYTLLAVAPTGKASSTYVAQGGFRVRPPARRVTLHLRAPNGVYAGPVVVGRRGTRAILGVRPGGRLGRVEVLSTYARPARRLARRWLARALTARARRGVPIGAGRFGRVRSKPPRDGVPGDRDVDGIPFLLDIDDDGDRILDNLEGLKHARAAQAALPSFNFEFNLQAALGETANARAAGLTVAQTDALLVSRGDLSFDILPGDSAELDCGTPRESDPLGGGLVYCSSGGTGRVVQPGLGGDPGRPFPDCCDADGDGFGTLTRPTLLRPGATADQIGTGDVMIQRVTTGGVEARYVAVLQYVFATVPALRSYDDGEGDAATVAYPVAATGQGTQANPFPVKAGPSGDIVVTLTFWRPQRRAIPGEASGEWTDIGGLIYEVEGGQTGRDCPQDAYATNEPNLTPAPMAEAGEGEDPTGGLRDTAVDGSKEAGRTLTVSVNLSACLRARRAELSGPETWMPGETKSFSVRGTDRTSYTSQTIAFVRR